MDTPVRRRDAKVPGEHKIVRARRVVAPYLERGECWPGYILMEQDARLQEIERKRADMMAESYP